MARTLLFALFAAPAVIALKSSNFMDKDVRYMLPRLEQKRLAQQQEKIAWEIEQQRAEQRTTSENFRRLRGARYRHRRAVDGEQVPDLRSLLLEKRRLEIFEEEDTRRRRRLLDEDEASEAASETEVPASTDAPPPEHPHLVLGVGVGVFVFVTAFLTLTPLVLRLYAMPSCSFAEEWCHGKPLCSCFCLLLALSLVYLLVALPPREPEPGSEEEEPNEYNNHYRAKYGIAIPMAILMWFIVDDYLKNHGEEELIITSDNPRHGLGLSSDLPPQVDERQRKSPLEVTRPRSNL